MRTLGSLSSRLFIASALLATVSIGAAMLFVSVRLTREHDQAMARGIDEAIARVELQRRSLHDTSARLARLVADLPKLKAALATRDAPTIAPIVASYRDDLGADVLIVSDAEGTPLFTAGDVRGEIVTARLPLDPRPTSESQATNVGALGERALPAPNLQPSPLSPLSSPLSPLPPLLVTMLGHPRGLLQVVILPVVLGFDPAEQLGSLSVGTLLDDRRARQLRSSAGTELAFVLRGRVLASTLGEDAATPLQEALAAGTGNPVVVNGDAYAWRAHALAPLPGEHPSGDRAPQAMILQSTAASSSTLRSVRLALLLIAVLTTMLASVVSYAVARTITRPLASLTSAMGEMARTGDLTRRVALPARSAWDDEDARVLAGTFDALTHAIARFQREAAERDRLSALGRLSTVIAHEIRNPLMIVRGSLRVLTQRSHADAAVAEAAADIEGEVLRLDRVVNDVLDFVRPVQVEIAPMSLNAVCRDAVAALVAADPDPPVTLDLSPDVEAIEGDADRLRTVLINVIANARDSVREPRSAVSGAPVAVMTRRDRDGAASVTVQDHGQGIEPEHIPHIFDPYFTTRRTGTGLGLAIARNIVDGLGGTIRVDSEHGVGTTVVITLPRGENAA